MSFNFKRISVMFPTRGRPQMAHRSIQRLIDTASDNKDIEYLLAVDIDDKQTFDYFEQTMVPLLSDQKISFHIFILDRYGYQNLYVYINFLAAQSQGNWMMFWNDDCIMQSQNWDLDIEQYNGQFKLLKFQDNHNHHPFALFPVLPRTWFELFGQISPHAEYDAWLSHVCYAVDCVQPIPTQIYHDRFDLTGNNNDQTYHARSNPGDFWTKAFIEQRWKQMHTLAQYIDDLGQNTAHWQKLQTNNLLNNFKDLYAKMLENDPNQQIKLGGEFVLNATLAEKILQQIQQPNEISHHAQPYVSIVVAGRNDDYGDKFLPTLKRFIKHLDYQLEHHQLNLIELIVVEWNPLTTEPLLNQILSPAKNFSVRIITVPNQVHNTVPNNPPPVLEFWAKNVGSRRARGQFILATNPDIIFTQQVIDKIAQRQLQHNTVYRIDHYNFDGQELDYQSVDKWIDYALTHTHSALLTTDQSWITVRLSPSLPKKIHYLPQSNLNKIVTVAGVDMPIPHLNSCGSFMLLSKQSLEAVNGFYENLDRMIDSIDSISMVRMLLQGMQQEFWPTPMCLFHKAHGTKSYVWNQHDVFDQAQKPAKLQWGMPEQQFEETQLRPVLIN